LLPFALAWLGLLLHPPGEHSHEPAGAVGHGKAPLVDVGKAAQVQVLDDRFNALGAANYHELHGFAAFGGGFGGLGVCCRREKGGVAEVDGRGIRLRYSAECVDVLAA
jgi:hypothetical protein